MLGGPGSLVILGIALLVLGPKKLQELARGIGGMMEEFKKTTEELKKSVGIDELRGVKTHLTGVDLFAEVAERVSAPVYPKEETGQAPPRQQDSVAPSSPLSVNVEKTEKGNGTVTPKDS